MKDASVIVTRDFLEAGKSDRGAWSKLQLMCIGVAWPPPKGWRKSVIGRAVSNADASNFLSLRNRRKPDSKDDLPTLLHTGPFVCKRCERELPIDSFDDSPKKDRVKKSICRSCCKELSKTARAYARFLRKLGPKKVVDGKSYMSRSMWLKQLGFGSYRNYLASSLWKEIRTRVYKAKGRICYLCGAPAEELHHNRYHRSDLRGKNLRFINPICRECHEAIEFVNGKKQNVKEASRAFKKRRELYRA